MQLEDYFDFQRPDDIRIKGHRIGIESVLAAFIEQDMQPREIAERYPSLSLEEVYATILYYLHNEEQVGAYYQAHVEYCRAAKAERERNPSPAALRMLDIQSQLDGLSPDERVQALRRMAEERRMAEREASEAAPVPTA